MRRFLEPKPSRTRGAGLHRNLSRCRNNARTVENEG